MPDESPDDAPRALDPPASVLLCERSGVDVPGCADFLDPAEPGATDALFVTVAQSPSDRLDVWRRHFDEPPAHVGVVSVADRVRSAAAAPDGGPARVQGAPVRTVDDPGDLLDVGTEIVGFLSEWEGNGNRVVVCVHSVEALVDAAPFERVCDFIDELAGHLDRAGAVSHYHLADGCLEDEQRDALEPLFDEVVCPSVGDGAEPAASAPSAETAVDDVESGQSDAAVDDADSPVEDAASAATDGTETDGEPAIRDDVGFIFPADASGGPTGAERSPDHGERPDPGAAADAEDETDLDARKRETDGNAPDDGTRTDAPESGTGAVDSDERRPTPVLGPVGGLSVDVDWGDQRWHRLAPRGGRLTVRGAALAVVFLLLVGGALGAATGVVDIPGGSPFGDGTGDDGAGASDPSALAGGGGANETGTSTVDGTTDTATASPTEAGTATRTATPSATPTPVPTPTRTGTPIPVPTPTTVPDAGGGGGGGGAPVDDGPETPTAPADGGDTETATPTPGDTATATPTATATGTATATPTETVTSTPTATATEPPTASETPTPTPPDDCELIIFCG